MKSCCRLLYQKLTLTLCVVISDLKPAVATNSTVEQFSIFVANCADCWRHKSIYISQYQCHSFFLERPQTAKINSLCAVNRFMVYRSICVLVDEGSTVGKNKQI